MRPYKLAQRAMDSAASLLFSTLYAIEQAGRWATRRPIHSIRRLIAAMHDVTVARRKFHDAQQLLALAAEALARATEEEAGDGPQLLEWANERCQAVEKHLALLTYEVALGTTEHLEGIVSGELVPEADPWVDPRRRPRIVVKHRPLFVRAFLTARWRKRVADRITPLLRRRRRTPCPAEVRVPRRNLRDRAPPFSSTCSL